MDINYREAIQRRKVAIELFKETIDAVKKNEHNELTLLDMRFNRGYPTVENLEEAIEVCEEEIKGYTEMIYEEQFHSLIDKRINKNWLKGLSN